MAVLNKYRLISKNTNSFGDLIVHLFDNVNSKVVTMSFMEGEWWQLDIILKTRGVD